MTAEIQREIERIVSEAARRIRVTSGAPLRGIVLAANTSDEVLAAYRAAAARYGATVTRARPLATGAPDGDGGDHGGDYDA